MATDPRPTALGYQSVQDAALDRRVATITRVLNWMGRALLVISLVTLVLTISPVSPFSDQGVAAAVLGFLGIGALYLVRAVRIQNRNSLIVGGVTFVLLALAVVALLIYGVAELLGEAPTTWAEAALMIVIFSAVFLPISLGLLAIGWGLLRLGTPLSRHESSTSATCRIGQEKKTGQDQIQP